ncbi:MAG: thiamine pyrophosphate-dependent enzyme [Acidimicrobiales bacterium]
MASSKPARTHRNRPALAAAGLALAAAALGGWGCRAETPPASSATATERTAPVSTPAAVATPTRPPLGPVRTAPCPTGPPYFEVERQSVLMSGYLGSIGFGFPAAMGAWAAVGDRRQVVAVTGDGGFGQYAMEWTTAVRYGMDVTHVLLDNAELGKISKEQRAVELDVWQTDLANPDFTAFAELCGARAWKVERADQLDHALAAALAHRGPSVVHVLADVALL